MLMVMTLHLHRQQRWKRAFGKVTILGKHSDSECFTQKLLFKVEQHICFSEGGKKKLFSFNRFKKMLQREKENGEYEVRDEKD